MGWGIGHDVREAYLFLAENYSEKRGDQIFIFGFSRGAYAARILSAMVHIAGIQSTTNINGYDKKYQYVENIYDAYKGEKTISKRREDVSKVLGYQPKSQEIEFVGLWDTVEALGVPDYEENWILPNERYGDQLCNINSAAHAVSIDDDRARIFTPILLTTPHLITDCPGKKIDIVVDEVWFSGAHADVGGGYKDSNVGGVSLNWMLGKISKYDIAPKGARVYSNYVGVTHDPEDGLWGLIYRQRQRDLYSYATLNEYNNKKLRIHKSVLDRLHKIPPKDHEFQWLDSKFKECFISDSGRLKYITDSNCFDIVE